MGRGARVLIAAVAVLGRLGAAAGAGVPAAEAAVRGGSSSNGDGAYALCLPRPAWSPDEAGIGGERGLEAAQTIVASSVGANGFTPAGAGAGGAVAATAGTAGGRRAEPRPGVERAQVMLRSITVPGWGQATLERRTASKVFFLAELGVWVSFTSFRIQEHLRRQASEVTARVLAGIDLSGRDEEYRRTVGSYISSDEYNQLVVYRDAANVYPDDPARYREYIAEHELKGADTWAWRDEESLLRYRAQRQSVHRAATRAQTALTVAIINRLVSAVHAGRAGGSRHQRAWQLEVIPVGGGDPASLQVGVRTRF